MSACKAKEKPGFIFSGELDNSIELLNKGFSGVAYSIDAKMLADAYKNHLKLIQDGLNEVK